ncbi:MAG: CDP-alcohol phosphatidyltransferase family protein [Lentisphaerae bacterium]|nr:CDP-alcohol phosphatidyltransferase family protein [Lentisphaerota bacterium]
MNASAKLGWVTFLTFVRFPLVLLFFVGAIIYSGRPDTWLFAVSFAALILSAVTDLLDGYLARRLNVVTPFGAHVDPLMDKFFYLATFPLLVFVAMRNGHTGHGILLLVFTMLFLARDQWVTFLRSIGSMYRVSGAANWSGKLRTGLTFPLICTVYYYEESPWPFLPPLLVYAFETVAMVINVLSLVIYTRLYWPYLRRSARVSPARGKAS